MLVTVDKNDFVVSVSSDYATSAMREIERSEAMPEATPVQRCTGPFHAHSGRYEDRPVSEFSINPKTGERYKTCDKCRNYANPKKVAASLPPPTHEWNTSNAQHKWEVTIIRETVVTVYAKDYLDAGIEAGEGEVTNVRRID